MIVFRDGSCDQSPEEGRWVRVYGQHQAQEGQALPQSRGLRREARIHQGLNIGLDNNLHTYDEPIQHNPELEKAEPTG